MDEQMNNNGYQSQPNRYRYCSFGAWYCFYLPFLSCLGSNQSCVLYCSIGIIFTL